MLGHLLLLDSQNAAVQGNRRFLSDKHLTSPNKRLKENDIGASQLNTQPYLPPGDLVVLKPHPQYTVAIMLFSALILNINKHPKITRHLKSQTLKTEIKIIWRKQKLNKKMKNIRELREHTTNMKQIRCYFERNIYETKKSLENLKIV